MRQRHQQRQKESIQKLLEQNYDRLKSDIVGTFKALDRAEGTCLSVDERGHIIIEPGEKT